MASVVSKPTSVAASLLIAVAAVTLAPPTAQAATVAFSDPRGDAVARYDLTRVKIDNGDSRLVATVRVRNLLGKGKQILGLDVQPAQADATYMVYSVRRANGSTTNWVDAYGPDAIDSGCKVSASWRPGKDTIRVSVRRDCIQTGKVRAQVFMGAGDGSSGDPADWTKFVGVRQG